MLTYDPTTSFILDEDRRVVADVHRASLGPVMAAAPELLEVAKRVAAKGHYDTCSLSLGAYPCDCPYALALAALDKAGIP